ncbi:MAG: response regulator [Bdellovibrionales bacterium]|nr:response regulator [Bdellovibrionales bacterium]MBT3525486.1 response regulator [Bdellovibrionales bacterium]MBT7670241.1 response regulator [Bdellovibrionales bacterium]MBT7767391.1 response regulator [Bdellovibrionales bacterium]
MRIKHKLLVSLISLSLTSMLVVGVFSLLVQQRVITSLDASISHDLPGSMALTHISLSIYKTLQLLNTYENSPSFKVQKQITTTLSELAINQTLHTLHHNTFHKIFRHDNSIDHAECTHHHDAESINQDVNQFIRGVNRYLSLINHKADKTEIKRAQMKVSHFADNFLTTNAPEVSAALSDTTKTLSKAVQLFDNYRLIIYILIVVMIVISIIISVLLANVISKPLNILMDGVKKISAGNFKTIIAVKSKDEFGELAHDFNQMSQNLEQSYFQLQDEVRVKEQLATKLEIHRNDLEQTVEQRTEQLDEQVKIANQANQAKSMFLANMSHDIRTPMNAVIGFTNLALETDIAQRQKNYIHKSNQAAKGLLSLINDILDFSKIEANQLTLEESKFELDSVIEGSLALFNLDESSQVLRVVAEIAPDVPNQLRGDFQRLRQVLINLVGNAVKFSDKETPVKLRVEQKAIDGEMVELKFTVQDRGVGISKEQQKKIFTPFEQVEQPTTPKSSSGTGLGLPISKQIVEKMGGELWVESELNVGSLFHFTICLKLASGDYTMPEDDTQRAVIDLKGTQILVVEDNEINMEVIVEVLTSKGIVVQSATNGQEALDLLANETFDLVLMDCQMPVMDGYEATKQIRSQKSLQGLPIIALTASTMKGDKEKALTAKMDDHIAKPFDNRELLQTIAKWVNKKD